MKKSKILFIILNNYLLAVTQRKKNIQKTILIKTGSQHEWKTGLKNLTLLKQNIWDSDFGKLKYKMNSGFIQGK